MSAQLDRSINLSWRRRIADVAALLARFPLAILQFLFRLSKPSVPTPLDITASSVKAMKTGESFRRACKRSEASGSSRIRIARRNSPASSKRRQVISLPQQLLPIFSEAGEQQRRFPALPPDEAEKDRCWSQLMAAAQDGDRVAYGALLRDCVPFIRTVVQSQHRAPDRIEEVVQEVLLTVHRVRHTYDPGRPFRHWLAVIARRRSIDALRRCLRRSAGEIADDMAHETFADPNANRSIEATDAKDEVSEAIASLSLAQREAVELLKLRELSSTEASRISGKSVATLKVNAHRAIKSFGKWLQGAAK